MTLSELLMQRQLQSPGGLRKDVLHILTDCVALLNDMPHTNPP